MDRSGWMAGYALRLMSHGSLGTESYRTGPGFEPAQPSQPACESITSPSSRRPSTQTTGSTRPRSKRGDGSIARLETNKGKITIDAGRDKNGKRRRRSRTIYGTKAQASQALASLTVEIADGTARPVSSPLWCQSRHARSNGNRQACGAIIWWIWFGPQLPRAYGRTGGRLFSRSSEISHSRSTPADVVNRV